MTFQIIWDNDNGELVNLDLEQGFDLAQADYEKERVIKEITEVKLKPTKKVIQELLLKELNGNLFIVTGQIGDEIIEKVKATDNLEIKTLTKIELLALLRSYNLDKLIEDTQKDLLHPSTDLGLLLSLKEGYLVGISACRGNDCSRQKELEEDLAAYKTEVVGPRSSYWVDLDGTKFNETGFLKHAPTRKIAMELIDLGDKKYNQDDVLAWALPLTLEDFTIHGEGTELDGVPYYITLDKVVLSKKDLPEEK